MAKEMHYHQPGCKPQRLAVIVTHDDGTVDLGIDGRLLHGKCPVGPQPNPQHGYASEISSEKAEKIEPNPLEKLTKDELLAKAASEGVNVDPKLTKADIIAALDAAKAK